MIIVYCVDNRYLPIMMQSIKSVRKYNPTAKIIVASPRKLGYYPVPGLEFEELIIPVNRNFRTRGPGDRITATAYLRHYLPTALPQYDKIIYMDSDVICQRPLNSLWEMPCDFINCTESHSYGKTQAKELGLEKYALSGMMVMNLKALREFNWLDKCLEVEKLPISNDKWQHDETMLNIAGKGHLNFISPAYNYCHNRTYDNPINEREAYLLHIVGVDKKPMFEQTFYESIPQIKNGIRGRRVAIVGNAKSLFDHNYGKEIDSYDFVIRFNKGFIIDRPKQGNKTSLLMLGCTLSWAQIATYQADWVLNRSAYYKNPGSTIIPAAEREHMYKRLHNKHPSTGHMAIDLCLASYAKSIDLYGFDFEATPTFYNPVGFKTDHDYDEEKAVVQEYIDCGLVNIHS